MKKKYTIGIDFGTLSGRAVLVDVANGHVAASAVHAYTHGVMDTALPDGTALPDSWALQHPADYLEVLDATLPQLLRSEVAVNVGADNYDAVLVSEFESLEALEIYKNDPRHLAVAAICKEIRTVRSAIDIEK